MRIGRAEVVPNWEDDVLVDRETTVVPADDDVAGLLGVDPGTEVEHIVTTASELGGDCALGIPAVVVFDDADLASSTDALDPADGADGAAFAVVQIPCRPQYPGPR
ncbi:hypothetical protein [Nocardia cyriacigeorgica]|uniref:Uncharacterized protein n=1 Tax=Nocardia cyriacigeorgica TaxID=135487 RepID=A0A5R8NWZ5_9NOCA|nr:hypothetical protein [Nocardia cyriacigeorgica]TLF80761.1 hypothetical protein FEK34_03390 [Nocardia cyriacigeorgica]